MPAFLGVSVSADGRILAFAGKGLDFRGEVVVLDIDQNEVLAQCTTSQAAPVYVTLSRDGKTLVSYGPPMPAPTLTPAPKPKILQEIDPIETDDARTAQVWEVASGRELFKGARHWHGGQRVVKPPPCRRTRISLPSRRATGRSMSST